MNLNPMLDFVNGLLNLRQLDDDLITDAGVILKKSRAFILSELKKKNILNAVEAEALLRSELPDGRFLEDPKDLLAIKEFKILNNLLVDLNELYDPLLIQVLQILKDEQIDIQELITVLPLILATIARQIEVESIRDLSLTEVTEFLNSAANPEQKEIFGKTKSKFLSMGGISKLVPKLAYTIWNMGFDNFKNKIKQLDTHIKQFSFNTDQMIQAAEFLAEDIRSISEHLTLFGDVTEQQIAIVSNFKKNIEKKMMAEADPTRKTNYSQLIKSIEELEKIKEETNQLIQSLSQEMSPALLMDLIQRGIDVFSRFNRILNLLSELKPEEGESEKNLIRRELMAQMEPFLTQLINITDTLEARWGLKADFLNEKLKLAKEDYKKYVVMFTVLDSKDKKPVEEEIDNRFKTSLAANRQKELELAKENLKSKDTYEKFATTPVFSSTDKGAALATLAFLKTAFHDFETAGRIKVIALDFLSQVERLENDLNASKETTISKDHSLKISRLSMQLFLEQSAEFSFLKAQKDRAQARVDELGPLPAGRQSVLQDEKQEIAKPKSAEEKANTPQPAEKTPKEQINQNREQVLAFSESYLIPDEWNRLKAEIDANHIEIQPADLPMTRALKSTLIFLAHLEESLPATDLNATMSEQLSALNFGGIQKNLQEDLNNFQQVTHEFLWSLEREHTDQSFMPSLLQVQNMALSWIKADEKMPFDIRGHFTGQQRKIANHFETLLPLSKDFILQLTEISNTFPPSVQKKLQAHWDAISKLGQNRSERPATLESLATIQTLAPTDLLATLASNRTPEEILGIMGHILGAVQDLTALSNDPQWMKSLAKLAPTVGSMAQQVKNVLNEAAPLLAELIANQEYLCELYGLNPETMAKEVQSMIDAYQSLADLFELPPLNQQKKEVFEKLLAERKLKSEGDTTTNLLAKLNDEKASWTHNELVDLRQQLKSINSLQLQDAIHVIEKKLDPENELTAIEQKISQTENRIFELEDNKRRLERVELIQKNLEQGKLGKEDIAYILHALPDENFESGIFKSKKIKRTPLDGNLSKLHEILKKAEGKADLTLADVKILQDITGLPADEILKKIAPSEVLFVKYSAKENAQTFISKQIDKLKGGSLTAAQSRNIILLLPVEEQNEWIKRNQELINETLKKQATQVSQSTLSDLNNELIEQQKERSELENQKEEIAENCFELPNGSAHGVVLDLNPAQIHSVTTALQARKDFRSREVRILSKKIEALKQAKTPVLDEKIAAPDAIPQPNTSIFQTLDNWMQSKLPEQYDALTSRAPSVVKGLRTILQGPVQALDLLKIQAQSKKLPQFGTLLEQLEQVMQNPIMVDILKVQLENPESHQSALTNQIKDGFQMFLHLSQAIALLTEPQTETEWHSLTQDAKQLLSESLIEPLLASCQLWLESQEGRLGMLSVSLQFRLDRLVDQYAVKLMPSTTQGSDQEKAAMLIEIKKELKNRLNEIKEKAIPKPKGSVQLLEIEQTAQKTLFQKFSRPLTVQEFSEQLKTARVSEQALEKAKDELVAWESQKVKSEELSLQSQNRDDDEKSLDEKSLGTSDSSPTLSGKYSDSEDDLDYVLVEVEEFSDEKGSPLEQPNPLLDLEIDLQIPRKNLEEIANEIKDILKTILKKTEEKPDEKSAAIAVKNVSSLSKIQDTKKKLFALAERLFGEHDEKDGLSLPENFLKGPIEPSESGLLRTIKLSYQTLSDLETAIITQSPESIGTAAQKVLEFLPQIKPALQPLRWTLMLDNPVLQSLQDTWAPIQDELVKTIPLLESMGNRVITIGKIDPLMKPEKTRSRSDNTHELTLLELVSAISKGRDLAGNWKLVRELIGLLQSGIALGNIGQPLLNKIDPLIADLIAATEYTLKLQGISPDAIEAMLKPTIEQYRSLLDEKLHIDSEYPWLHQKLAFGKRTQSHLEASEKRLEKLKRQLAEPSNDTLKTNDLLALRQELSAIPFSDTANLIAAIDQALEEDAGLPQLADKIKDAENKLFEFHSEYRQAEKLAELKQQVSAQQPLSAQDLKYLLALLPNEKLPELQVDLKELSHFLENCDIKNLTQGDVLRIQQITGASAETLFHQLNDQTAFNKWVKAQKAVLEQLQQDPRSNPERFKRLLLLLDREGLMAKSQLSAVTASLNTERSLEAIQTDLDAEKTELNSLLNQETELRHALFKPREDANEQIKFEPNSEQVGLAQKAISERQGFNHLQTHVLDFEQKKLEQKIEAELKASEEMASKLINFYQKADIDTRVIQARIDALKNNGQVPSDWVKICRRHDGFLKVMADSSSPEKINEQKLACIALTLELSHDARLIKGKYQEMRQHPPGAPLSNAVFLNTLSQYNSLGYRNQLMSHICLGIVKLVPNLVQDVQIPQDASTLYTWCLNLLQKVVSYFQNLVLENDICRLAKPSVPRAAESATPLRKMTVAKEQPVILPPTDSKEEIDVRVNSAGTGLSSP